MSLDISSSKFGIETRLTRYVSFFTYVLNTNLRVRLEGTEPKTQASYYIV